MGIRKKGEGRKEWVCRGGDRKGRGHRLIYVDAGD